MRYFMMAICHLEEDYIILLENIWNILEIIFTYIKCLKELCEEGKIAKKQTTISFLIME